MNDTTQDAKPVAQEPVAFMFVTKKGGTRREFAAIEYWEEPGETVVSKTPLFSAPQPQAAPQEPVAELQHSRDGVWVHLHCGGNHVSINLSADKFTRGFALEYAKHQSQNGGTK